MTDDDLQKALASFQGLPMTPETRARIDAFVRTYARRTGKVLPVFWLRRRRVVHVGPLDAEQFARVFGRPPEVDDLERVNCTAPPTVGHLLCGVCDTHEVPRFWCACAAGGDAA